VPVKIVSRIAGVIAAAAILAAAAYYLVPIARQDTDHPHLREMTIPVSGLFREVRILHVTDLHDRRFGPGQSEVVDLLAGKRVDAVVFTGDLVTDKDTSARPALELVDALRPLAARMYSVPGNHEDARFTRTLAARGVKTIDPGETLTIGGPATGVVIVSADRAGTLSSPRAPGARVLVVAMHQPPGDALLAGAAKMAPGTELVLAGHTHGGQLRIPGIGAVVAPRDWGIRNITSITDQVFPDLRGFMVDGAYRRGRQYVDVSPGLGTTLLPFRLFSPAEVTMIRLVPAP
jgi:predicted MPP superfamily phosphohydrolase